MDQPSDDVVREHAWNYFELHANQRISVFNFFVGSAGLVFAALASIIVGTDKPAWLGVVVGLLLVMLSLVFWKLDRRVAMLVERAVEALAYEERRMPMLSQVFALDQTWKKDIHRPGYRLKGVWTYDQSFGLIFSLVACLGLIGAGYSALRMTRPAGAPHAERKVESAAPRPIARSGYP